MILSAFITFFYVFGHLKNHLLKDVVSRHDFYYLFNTCMSVYRRVMHYFDDGMDHDFGYPYLSVFDYESFIFVYVRVLQTRLYVRVSFNYYY
jgi:hypothetical protein